MATERIANIGYMGLQKETVPGQAQSPTDFIPLYDQSLNTNMNFTDQNPIYGNKYKTFGTLKGNRDHKGDFTVLAEPNTTAKLFDMLLTRTSTTGSAGLFTHIFQLTSGDSNSYTLDFSTGNIVMRIFGFKASKIAPNWNKSELQWKVSGSALGSFFGRTLASAPSGTGTFTVTLDTDYDQNPTNGLVIGDLIRFYKAAGTTIDATVLAVTNGTTFTTSTDVSSMLAGDMVYLRPATAAFTLLPSLIWPKTEFHFGATAATALTNPQLRIETGSTYEIDHTFESDSGSARSGGYDPASLVRSVGDSTLNVKKFFDTPDDIQNWNKLTKTAVVVRHYSGTTNQYEVRATFNHVKTDGVITPSLKSGAVSYSDIKYHNDYDLTDGQAYSLLVTNALATI
jgi:hypothetical protein